MAISTALSLLILGFVSILSFQILYFIFVFIGWTFALIILLLEFPWCTKCCPTSQKFDSFLKKFEANGSRTILYCCMSVILWLAFLVGTPPVGMIFDNIFMTLTALFYSIAMCKNETPKPVPSTGNTTTAGASQV